MITVQTDNLTKIYYSSFKRKNVQALSSLNLTVDSGMIFGFLGPNGAGKTTLVKILLGITHPTSGSAKILGEDIKNYKVKKRIGYLPENHRYPFYLTGEGVLKFFGKLSGVDDKNLNKKVDQLLDLVNLGKWKKTKIKNYSKGMMQRLGLAQAVINDPELIFLDEPTDGVDPIGRKEIRDLLLDLKSQGKTIFLNSHLLSEVELITDRVAILNKGILLREGTVKELTEKKEEYQFSIDGENRESDLQKYSSEFSFSNFKDGSFVVKVGNINELNVFIDYLRRDGKSIKAVIPQKETLEEMFIALINETEGKKK
ncbi:MAG: ABC transporter ATP-binding protein [Ignavibacteriales bacterium]|nr:ABC transporter ATP-binding protein [Ignavibacteriales bacterium]